MARKKKAAKGGAKRVGRVRLDQLDVSELRQLVDQKLAQLTQQQADLRAQLAEVENAIAALTGGSAQAAPAASASAAQSTVSKTSAGRGPRSGMTLGNTIEDILRQSGQPMQVKDVVAAVQASDYPSTSKHLRSMVNQTLSADKRFRKVGRGKYRISG